MYVPIQIMHIARNLQYDTLINFKYHTYKVQNNTLSALDTKSEKIK